MVEDDEPLRVTREFTYAVDPGGSDIADAFGIGEEFKNRVVDIALPTPLPKLVFITGESGSGKSTLLREIAPETAVTINPDEPLYRWGETNRVLEVLSLVGLGDATIFLSPYRVLSDSQKARARIAKAVLEGNKQLIFDEFLSTLDRLSARVIAYSFQRLVRRYGLSALVATAHDDIEPYLRPDLLVRGLAFPSRWEITTPTYDAENPFLLSAEIEAIDGPAYHAEPLAELHYKGKWARGARDYWRLKVEGRIVGLLAVGTRWPSNSGRRISRVVIHPTFRGAGLGKYLVQKYLAVYPDTDVLAAMAKYSPIFERAGMTKGKPVKFDPPAEFVARLTKIGFDPKRWVSKAYCLEFCRSAEVRETISGIAYENRVIEQPDGMLPGSEEIKLLVRDDPKAAARILWYIRPREIPHFIGPGLAPGQVAEPAPFRFGIEPPPSMANEW